MTLVEFLRARLDEDAEAVQRIAGRRWYACDDGHVEEAEREGWADGSDRLPNHHNTWLEVLNTDRVLADVEAKRRIIDLHQPYNYGPWYETDSLIVCAVCGPHEDVDFQTKGRGNYPCDTLRLLAQPYADHPDFDQEWKL